MNIRNLSKRETVFLLLTLFLAAIFILYNMALEPLILGWASLYQQIESRQNTLNKYKTLLTSHKSMKEGYLAHPVISDFSGNEEKAISEALEEIENISKKTSCFILNIKPGAARKIGEYKEISFEILMEGGVREFARFLYDVETSKKLLRIKKYLLTSKSGPSSKLRGVFTVTRLILI